MLVDHPFMMLSRYRRQSLRDKVVPSVPGSDLDHLTLLAQVGHIVDEQQFDTTIWAFWQSP